MVLSVSSVAPPRDDAPLSSAQWLGYAFIGSVCYCVMVALGEMISHLPIAGGHLTLAKRYVDPALSFTMGWNYWYNWTIGGSSGQDSRCLTLFFSPTC